MTENILEVRNLVKDYGDFSLKQLCFDVPRGSIVGLIGENGAGKSTTINCILNEVQKNSGKILLFGKDYLQNEVENKNKIGVVFDENHFPDIFTPFEIASYMSGIYMNWNTGVYREYLKKFDLPANKAIKGFSKGMKVKLAFAVALSHKAELLILDEATSALDSVTEAKIQASFDRLCEGRTSIIIAHRLSTIRNADRIAVVDREEIIEQGSHPSLMAQNGEYAALVRAQEQIAFSKNHAMDMKLVGTLLVPFQYRKRW